MTVIFVPRERTVGESRVSLLPETIGRLVKKSHEVLVESGAGVSALVGDDQYRAVGAKIVEMPESAYERADLIVGIHPPTSDVIGLLRSGSVYVSYSYPEDGNSSQDALASRGVSMLAVDRVPRTTLAQMMDVLSSQATVAGYRAVILAAEASQKMFPMLMTAAGTISPARVLVLGAGVAGLQAIATAKRLGAVIEAYDVRTVAKEQVESLGAKFVNLGIEDASGSGGYAKELTAEQKERQQAALASVIAKQDIVITTAMVPSRRAPILVTAAMVAQMHRGAVIVDIAAERGGNCELTRPGERFVTDKGVTIIGDVNLPSRMAANASQMYSRNMEKLLLHITGDDGLLKIDLTDEITRGMLIPGHPSPKMDNDSPYRGQGSVPQDIVAST